MAKKTQCACKLKSNPRQKKPSGPEMSSSYMYRNNMMFNRHMASQLFDAGWTPEQIAAGWPAIWSLGESGGLMKAPGVTEGTRLSMAGVQEALVSGPEKWLAEHGTAMPTASPKAKMFREREGEKWFSSLSEEKKREFAHTYPSKRFSWKKWGFKGAAIPEFRQGIENALNRWEMGLEESPVRDDPGLRENPYDDPSSQYRATGVGKEYVQSQLRDNPAGIPKEVERYYRETMEAMPSYTPAQGWATAWSRYCKYKKPDSPHCRKETEEYFSNPGYDQMVKDRTYLPKSLSKRYVKELKRRFGQSTKIEVMKSETTMPRGWDYGNHTLLKITLPNGQIVNAAITLNIAEGESSGNFVVDSVVIGLGRGSTPEQAIGMMLSDVGDRLGRGRRTNPTSDTENNPTNTEVAETIARQMGGAGKLRAMLGAQLLASEDSLTIKWPSKYASKGNTCVIKLDEGTDTYSMEFWWLPKTYTKGGPKKIKTYDMLYADQLVEVFEKHTGYYLSLGPRRNPAELEESISYGPGTTTRIYKHTSGGRVSYHVESPYAEPFGGFNTLEEAKAYAARAGEHHAQRRRNPVEQSEPELHVSLGYDALNVFQRYWYGQWDPLYAMLSRRGNSVSIVGLEVSQEELNRFEQAAEEIVQHSDDPSELRVAKKYLKLIPGWRQRICENPRGKKGSAVPKPSWLHITMKDGTDVKLKPSVKSWSDASKRFLDYIEEHDLEPDDLWEPPGMITHLGNPVASVHYNGNVNTRWMSMYQGNPQPQLWSGEVETKWSPPEGFFQQSAQKIAQGLKKNSKDLRQAMSRLNFYINRAGANLTPPDKKRLELAKTKLRGM